MTADTDREARLEEIRKALDDGWRTLGYDEEPWWWPTPTDEEWLARIREDYPEDAHFSDGHLRDKYADGGELQTLWDHTGDAYADYKKIVEAMAGLLSEIDRLKAKLEGEADRA